MERLTDYPCKQNTFEGFSDTLLSLLNFEFPRAYQKAETMAHLASQDRSQKGRSLCILPFCHTVEGENLGAKINYGDERIGPRAGEYRMTEVEDLLSLPEIDPGKGHMAEVLHACRILHEQGEIVALEMSGPFTILSTIIDLSTIIRRWRKKPGVIERVILNLQASISTYFRAAKDAGVTLLSYSDSAGGLNILGPKYMEWITVEFTYPFLKEVQSLSDELTMIQLCPKLSFALTGLGLAEWVEIPLTRAMTYEQACLDVLGKADFVGQCCIKDNGVYLNESIRTIRLL